MNSLGALEAFPILIVQDVVGWGINSGDSSTSFTLLACRWYTYRGETPLQFALHSLVTPVSPFGTVYPTVHPDPT